MGDALLLNFGGGGGNKPDYYLRVTVALPTGQVQPTDGFTVSATKDGETVSGNTDSTGVCTLMLAGTGAYTVEVSHTGFVTKSASIVVTDVLTQETINTNYQTYTVSGTITHGSISVSSATYNTQLDIDITPSANYDKPAAKTDITVTIGGTTFTTFTYSSGTVTIDGEYVTGNVVVTATCPPKTYSVTYSITNGSKTSGPTTVTYNDDVEIVVAADTGYDLPGSVSVMSGSTAVTHTWSQSTGKITMVGGAITGDITVTVTCAAKTFAVTKSATGGTWAGDTTATYGVAYTATLTASAHHDLPSSVTVTVGGTAITSHTFSSGSLTIPASAVTGAISIDAACTAKSYAVTKTATGGTWTTGGTTATYGVVYQATLTADTGYTLPTAVTVKVGGAEISAHTWDASGGVLRIPGDQITDEITITATCKPPYVEGSVSFNAETFKTDPKGCLTYGGDLAGKTPVSNSGTGLHTVTEEGDWGFDMTSTDIDKKGTNMFGMFYCTFTSAGVRHEKLDPYNLAQKIATWNDTTKKWTAESGASSITTENTMLMIPTLYWKGDSNGFTITQSSASGGTAYAHTVGGKKYKWLAIGVYISYNNSSKAMSLSGKTATGSVKRADWRTYSRANTVVDGKAMQWNYWQWMLMRFLSYLSCKSFNCQLQIGNGGNDYSSGVTGGCNALGPYAGDVSGTASSVKCLIEDFWGYKYQFVDDCVTYSDGFYAGQNDPASVDDTTSGKTKIWNKTDSASSNGFPATILTTDKGWGLGQDASGDKSKGLCDYNYLIQSDYSTTYKLLSVGGYSGHVSDGSAGPGFVGDVSLTYSNAYYGSRLSFVLEEE